MAHIGGGIAQYISDLNISGVTYSPTSGGGSIFCDVVPPKPDVCVIVTVLGKDFETTSGLLNDRTYTIQVRVRAKNVSTAYSIADSVSEALNGTRVGGVLELSESVSVTVIEASTTGPVFMGVDANDRPEYVLRYTARVQPSA